MPQRGTSTEIGNLGFAIGNARQVPFMGFDFDAEQRRRLGYKLIDHINDYFSSLLDRPVQLPLEQRTFGQLTDKMPELGLKPELVLDEVCEELAHKGFHVPAANYFG